MMDQKIVAEELAKIEVGFLPADVFYQIARLVPLVAIEIVPIRLDQGTAEVLMLRRDEADPFWPNAWHTPGSIVRAYDKKPDFKDAINRVLVDELKLDSDTELVYVKTTLQNSRRGKEVGLIYWAELPKPTSVGQFFKADNLPKDRVDSQHFITDAVQDFLNFKGVRL